MTIYFSNKYWLQLNKSVMLEFVMKKLQMEKLWQIMPEVQCPPMEPRLIPSLMLILKGWRRKLNRWLRNHPRRWGTVNMNTHLYWHRGMYMSLMALNAPIIAKIVTTIFMWLVLWRIDRIRDRTQILHCMRTTSLQELSMMEMKGAH